LRFIVASKKNPGIIGGRGRKFEPKLKEKIIHLVKDAQTNGARLHEACSLLGFSIRTYERWKNSPDKTDKRKGASKKIPKKLNDLEKKTILSIANSKEFASQPPSQIVPALADRGEYICSERTLYRLLKNEGMLNHRGKARPPQKRICPRLIAYKPNQIYSWDITYLPAEVKGKFYYLYLFMDIYSRYIVGWHIDEHQDNKIAAAVFKDLCLKSSILPHQLTLHSDNGGPMKGATMLSTMQSLGVIKSFSRPATSNDNPFSEALFKTVKYCPSYPRKPFKDIKHAETWMGNFTLWYNTEHKHSGIKFVTPYQRHHGLDKGILMYRKEVYESAKSRNPRRWSGTSRCWLPAKEVYINPVGGKPANEIERQLC
jgi:putative transposase